MTDEIVYSKIHDKRIAKNISKSPIWKECHKPEELDSKKGYFKYSIRFNGLKPVQVLSIKKIV